MDNQKNKPNRLIDEKSPYLLQHAYNPVDWYPWCPEAFAKAKEEDKPIFLSIGYSTCHWCHVMAHESFEDLETAEALNRSFICVKVDREERPDIDSVYMTVCQAVTGSGGWPLTIIMTPDQKPFYAATYLPKHSRYGTVGLLELSAAVSKQWQENRKGLVESGDKIVEFLQEQARKEPAGQNKGSFQNENLLQDDDRQDRLSSIIENALHLFQKNYDREWGGFSPAPKFPTPHNLLFLMEYAQADSSIGKKGEQFFSGYRKLSETAMQMAEHTLLQMYKGGIFDHIGGGFSRYSTDRKWLVPHFEKMLYDNALLASAYLKAYQLTKKDIYKTVAKRTMDYVLQELTHDQGGFFCGQDADSDGVEGKYYVFTPEEIKKVLGEPDGGWFCKHYDITPGGNFEGASIPNFIQSFDSGTDTPVLEPLLQKIYDYRLQRTKLHKDDKILTSWNGLMIAALADAGALLGESRYLNAAKSAERFIADHLMDHEGRLRIRWRKGEAVHNGLLDDYAFYGYALLHLYEATYDLSYLEKAVAMAEQISIHFSDGQTGGFYLYSNDSEQLISRPKEVYDGALPSGNSVAALLLVKLARLTGEQRWQEAADQQLHFIEDAVQHYPAGYSFSLLAILTAQHPSHELVCTVSEDAESQALLNELSKRKTEVQSLSILIKSRENEARLSDLVPFTTGYPIPESGIRFYLCQNRTCSAPVESLEQLDELLSFQSN